jgi:hypothetical protein
MTRRHAVRVVVAGLLMAACPPGADGAGEPKVEDRSARQTVEAFLKAALAGKVQEARAFVERGMVPENQVKELHELGVKELGLTSVHADDANAVAVTDKVTVRDAGGRREGHLLLTLVKKGKRWLVRDIDFEEPGRMKQKLKRFVREHPNAKLVE